jgi:hypothetical protein
VIRRVLGLLAVAALCLTLLWEVYSPDYVLKSMQDAARRGDAAAFSANVDYPALRTSVKAAVRKELERKAASDPAANAFKTAMAAALLDPIVDGMVSPAMIERSFLKGASTTDAERIAMNADMKVARAGMDAFVVRDASDPKAPGLVFKRHWPLWKLSEIQLPEGGL